MKQTFVRAAWLGTALCLVCIAAYSQATVDNATILKLLKAGVGDDTIITTVNQQPGKYSLSADELMALKKAGASEKVVAAMIVRNQAAPLPPLVLHDGDPISMRVPRELIALDLKPGDIVNLEVLDDVKVAGVLVLAHGTPAIGTIAKAEQKRRLGHAKLEVTLDCLRLLNGEKVVVKAHANPLLLLVHEEDVSIPKGTQFTASVDGEYRLDRSGFPDSQPAPQSTAPAVSGRAAEGLVDMAFTSTPQGALVTIYGAPIGRTPFVTKLAPGTYKAVFSIDGYYDLRQNIPVGPGYSNIVNAPFEMKQ